MLKILKKISPTAYTVISVLTNACSIGLTVLATKKTMKEMEEKKPETFGDKAKIVGKNFAPVLITYGVSAGSAIASNAKNLANQAVIASTAVAAMQTVKDYQGAIKEVCSNDEASVIETAVNKKKALPETYTSQVPVFPNADGEPMCWCVEASTRQMFLYPYQRIPQIKYRCIDYLRAHDEMLARDYYDIINDVGGVIAISQTSLSNDYGWRACDLIDEASGDVNFEVLALTEKARDGRPVILIDTEVPPYATSA